MSFKALTALLERFSLANLAGMQFGGKRNLYEVYGYNKTPTYADYEARYKRQDVAKRIVNAPASATWRNPPELSQETPDDFKTKWKALVENHQVWAMIDRADRLCGIGNYSVILLGFSKGGALETPARPMAGNELIYLQPYSQKQVSITKLDADPKSERFGMPEIYTIRMNDPLTAMQGIQAGVSNVQAVETGKALEQKVHWTRIVHIAEELTESNFLGTPRLQGVYNLLDDLQKVVGGSAETYWLMSNRGMQMDIDKEMEMDKGDAEALSKEIEEYQHDLRRFIRTKGVKMNPLGSQVASPEASFRVIMALISGTTGIPQRVLTGSEAGQLASDQDRANWSDRIKERRTTFAEPGILNPLAKALMHAGILPETELDKFGWVWPADFQLTPLEQAQMMAQKARAIINLSKHFQDGTPIISIEEARQIVDMPPVPLIGKIPAPIEVLPPLAPGAKKPKAAGNIKSDPHPTDNAPNDFQAKQ